MSKRFLILIILTVMLLFTGCDSISGGVDGDRLLGVCVTTSSISDIAGDDGKVYAVKSEEQDVDGFNYSFEDLEAAYAFLSTEVVKDENKDTFYQYQKAIEKNGKLKLTSGMPKNADSVSYTLISDIYLNRNSNPKDRIFHINWVYQDKEGQVYLNEADALSHGGDVNGFELGTVIAGVSRSGISKNKLENEPERVRTEVQANLVIQSPTEVLKFVEMDGENKVLAVREYSGDQIPEEYSISKEADYVIVEEEKRIDDKLIVFRKLLNKSDEVLEVVTESEENMFCDLKVIDIK